MPKKSRTSAPKRRSVTPEDLLNFQVVGNPRISPDGGRVVFVVKTVGEKNEYETNLWMVDAGGGEPRPFTGGNKDGAPRWSPDGERIAFVGGREKHRPQLYVIGAAGGEALPLTDFPEGSIGAFRWSPDGKKLAAAFREQDPDWTEAAKKDRKEQGLSDPPRVIDDWWYRLDGDGYFLAQRFRLYLIDAETGEHSEIYAKDTLGGFDFDFTPDGKEIVVATNRDKKALIRAWKTELASINVATGKLRPIKGPPAGPKTSVRVSPDGKRIAYAGRQGTDDIYSTENLELHICDIDGGNWKCLTADEDYCLLAVAIADVSEADFAPWLEFSADSKRVFTRIGTRGETHVASIPAGGGKLEFHTTGKLVFEPGNFSGDGSKLAMTQASPTALPEVVTTDCRKKVFRVSQLTNLNGPLLQRLELAEPAEHTVKADDGHEVHVWVMYPPNRKRGKKSPAVLEIHGGPHAQYGLGFFHEFQVLAAAGYTVLYSNPRGSKGYGRDHCAAIRGDWGGADWVDVQAVTRFMQGQRDLDASRLGVMGGSYGGYMTNWAIGHCRDFAAAITDRCVSNLVSMSGNSDFPMEPDVYFPGNAWDRPEERWRQSPLAYLGEAKTPTLVIHSEGDLRCNVEQSEQVFTALKLLNVPTRFVRYPSSTSHGMSRQGPPDLRIHRLRQILKWWEEWL